MLYLLALTLAIAAIALWWYRKRKSIPQGPYFIRAKADTVPSIHVLFGGLGVCVCFHVFVYEVYG